jgi:hypothetical protein
MRITGSMRRPGVQRAEHSAGDDDGQRAKPDDDAALHLAHFAADESDVGFEFVIGYGAAPACGSLRLRRHRRTRLRT